jgi:hypothetical protein
MTSHLYKQHTDAFFATSVSWLLAESLNLSSRSQIATPSFPPDH